MNHKLIQRPLFIAALYIGSASSHAYSLYGSDDTNLNLDVSAMFGGFHSDESYATAGTKQKGSSNWAEGFVKYGVSANHRLGNYGIAYGALGLLSSATWGDDGDAAGFTDGSERTTKIEDAYAGWRSGNLFTLLGEDGVDISGGRQNIVIGDGFIVAGDALNLGNGFADGMFNRGGAYYLAGRRNFDETFVLRLGGKEGWRGDLMRLKSDNPSQAKPEFYAATLEHVSEPGTLGLTYLDITDIDERFATLSQLDRKEMKVWSARGQGNAGVPDLFLSGEYAWQDKKQAGNENAWYLEAGWTFSALPLKPYVSYRYSRFSKGYDPLFFGFTRGFGTWFQGEVASNYAGPFSSNARVNNIGAKITPMDGVEVGLQWFDFSTIDKSTGNLDGRELDLYASWTVTPNVTVIPLVGIFKPSRSAEQGGTQLGSDDRNFYTQLVLSLNF